MRQLMDNETPQGVSDEWSTIPWRKLERYIFRLQKRIYQAKQRGDTRAVRGLKRVLKRSKAAKTLAVRQVTQDNKQLPLSPRRNGLPVKLIDWSCLMIREYSTRALIELMQIGKTPSGTDPVFHHAPEAFNRIEVVATMRRQEMQPKLLVPVCQRRRKLVRPMDATAVGYHDHLFAGTAKEGHHLMDVLAKPLRLKMGDNLIEDFGGPILDRADDTEQHPAGDTAPGAIAAPRVAFEALVAFDLALAQWTDGQASPLGFAPPARPGQGKTPEDGFIFIEQNDLTPASPIFEGSEFERRPRQFSRVGSEPSRGSAVADVFFLRRRGRSRG